MAARATILKSSKEFIIPFDQRVRNLVPDSRILRHPKRGQVLALPHRTDSARLCRNIGYQVPAPITVHYDWNGDTPFHTQKMTAALLVMNFRAYVLSEMGTGKTRAALHAINFLLQEGEIQAALIVAPLSTLSPVWDREVFQYFNHLSVGVLHGSRTRREQILNQKHHLYVVNHDGVKVIEDQLKAKQEIDCVVIDELAAFRNSRSDKWLALNNVLTGRRYVWGMTGSPTPKEPVDAYGQVKLLTPARVPTYINQFRRQTMRKVTQFKWVPLPDANETVAKVMQPAVRYTRDDCLELPPISYLARKVPFSKRQDEIYGKLMNKLALAFKEGEVKAANEGVLFSKLLQIATGWVYTSERQIVDTDSKPRIQALLETLEESSGKVIVYVEFIHAAEKLYQAIQKHENCAIVTGKTPKRQRDTTFHNFQNLQSPRVLLAHPKCMSHGLTLTAAKTIVWFTPTTSLETYEQANARITRPGQTSKQLILHLTGSKVETKMYKRLQEKRTLQGALLELFEGE